MMVQMPGVWEAQESGVAGVPWRKWLGSNPGNVYRTRDTSLYFLFIAIEKSEMRELPPLSVCTRVSHEGR